MIGLAVAAAGWVTVIVAVCLLFGIWPLIPAGVITLAVGVFVDLDSAKEPAHAQRHQSAPS